MKKLKMSMDEWSNSHKNQLICVNLNVINDKLLSYNWQWNRQSSNTVFEGEDEFYSFFEAEWTIQYIPNYHRILELKICKYFHWIWQILWEYIFIYIYHSFRYEWTIEIKMMEKIHDQLKCFALHKNIVSCEYIGFNGLAKSLHSSKISQMFISFFRWNEIVRILYNILNGRIKIL